MDVDFFAINNSLVKLKDNKGYIFVALNLLSISHFEEIFKFEKDRTIFWCDGIIALYHLKNRHINTSKIPGAEFTRRFLKHIKKPIILLGNMNEIERKLITSFNISIYSHYKLNNFKYSDLETITLDEQCSVLITLPSPLQEKAAYLLHNKFPLNNFFCIGGGLEMASNSKLEAPKLIRILHIEWTFRLKTDTKRRLLRLFSCLKKLKNYRKEIAKYKWVKIIE